METTDFFIEQLPNTPFNFAFLAIIYLSPLLTIVRSREEHQFFERMKQEKGTAYTTFYAFLLFIGFAFSRFLSFTTSLFGLFLLVEFGGFAGWASQGILALSAIVIWTTITKLPGLGHYSFASKLIITYMFEMFLMVGVGALVGFVGFSLN